jgi:hypothetical protein
MSHLVGIIGVMTSYPNPTVQRLSSWTTFRSGAHRSARPTVAAEPSGDYTAVPPAEDPAAGVSDDGQERAAPFGLAVLAELPALAGMLEAVATAEQHMLQATVGLARLLADDAVAHTTGVPVEHWLAIVCRQTRLDRRLLLRLARLLDRFPALAAGVDTGRVSFAQLRGVGLVVRQAPPVLDEALDELLARLLEQLQGCDPDVLVDQLRQALDELTPEHAAAETDTPANSLWLQPNLAGTGGRFGGELDTLALAILDAATAPDRSQLHHPEGVAGARADNLLTRLTHPNTAAADAAGGDATGDADAGAHAAADAAEDAGEAAGATDHAAGVGGDGDVGDAADADVAAGAAGGAGRVPWGVQAGGLLPPVKLLARVQLETLGALPADVLTRLTGGRLKLSSRAARWLLDQQQIDLRLIVIDDQGEAVGVGRRTRQPPGWLADITLAIHDTCTEPLCQRPALGADLDHAHPWWPHHPHDPYGTTDADNIGPLCPATNHDKEQAGWTVTQTGDGRRTWTHHPTALTITTVPATWRPTGWQPPHHHPPGSRPAGPDRPPSSHPPPHDGRFTYEQLRELQGLPPPPPDQPPPDPNELPF